MDNTLRLPFWKKQSGNYVSPSASMNEAQVAFFKGLNVGDRLILFTETVKKSEKAPDFVLKKLLKKAAVTA